MKKLLIVFGIIVGLLLIALTIIPMFYKDQIVTIIKEKANEQLACQMDFDDVGISLFRNFPGITVSVDGLTLVNRAPFEGDTLVHLNSFRVTIDLLSLISGESIEIVSILLDQPDIFLRVLEDGTPNWEIMKKTETVETARESEPGEFGLTLQGYEIRNANLNYIDDQTGMNLTAEGFNHEGSGDFSQDIVSLKTDTKIKSLRSGVGEFNYLNGVESHFAIETVIDKKNLSLKLKENQLRLNEFIFNLDGFLKIVEETTIVDLQFSTKETDFKGLISLIPDLYQNNFSQLETSGQFGFQGKILGNYSENEFPKFDIKFEATDGMLKLPGMPKPIEHFALELFVVNHGRDVNNTQVNLRKFHFEMDQQLFDARLIVSRPFSDLTFSGFVKGNIDLGDLKELLPLEENTEIDGLIQANLEFSGSQKKDLEIKGNGKLNLSDFTYSSPQLQEPFSLKEASISFTPAKVSLDRFNARIGKSDIHAEGQLENVLTYFLKDVELKGNLAISSNFFDLNPWMEGPSAELSAVELPGKIEFLMDVQFNEVLFDNLKLQNVRGSLVLKDKILKMYGLYMEALGGKMIAAGKYDSNIPQTPTIDFDLSISQVGFADAYKSFITVQTFAPIANHLHGNFNAKIKLSSQLDNNLAPLWQKFISQGKLDITSASLTDFVPFNEVAKAIKWDKMQNPVLNNFHPSYLIEEGRMKIDPFTVIIENTDMVVSGSYGIDKSLDFDLILKMPASELKGQTANALTNLVGKKVSLGNDETVDILVSVGGTYDNPIVKASLGDIVKKRNIRIETSRRV